MKNVTFVAALAIAGATMAGCGNQAPKANLKTDIDTLSYAIGMAQSNGLKEYLSGSMGVDTTYMAEFIKGLNEGANAGDNKRKAAYIAGLQIGQQISNQMVKGINYQLFQDDSTKTISLKNFMAGFISGTTGKKGIMTAQEASETTQRKMNEIREQSMLEKYADNKKAGEDFLKANAKKDGVKTLPCGVQYKVLVEGKGECPKDTSMVSVNYEGRLINGKVFDSSYTRNQPMETRANQLIKGWTEALKVMPVGSEWEIYIPQDLAYGAREAGEIKPFSALIFKIKLEAIK